MKGYRWIAALTISFVYDWWLYSNKLEFYRWFWKTASLETFIKTSWAFQYAFRRNLFSRILDYHHWPQCSRMLCSSWCLKTTTLYVFFFVRKIFDSVNTKLVDYLKKHDYLFHFQYELRSFFCATNLLTNAADWIAMLFNMFSGTGAAELDLTQALKVSCAGLLHKLKFMEYLVTFSALFLYFSVINSFM